MRLKFLDEMADRCIMERRVNLKISRPELLNREAKMTDEKEEKKDESDPFPYASCPKCFHRRLTHNEEGCLLSGCTCLVARAAITERNWLFEESAIKKLLLDAMKIVVYVHVDKTDLLGNPVLNHIFRVAGQMTGLESIVVGLLHDTIEDSGLDISELCGKTGSYIPAHLQEAVRLVSHSKNEPYLPYIKQLAGNALAREVKLADVLDNYSRLDLISDGHARDRLTAKYTAALEVLKKDEDI